MVKFTKKQWTYGFLGLTAAVIGMEVFAATNANDNAIPWTQMIVEHIPYEVTFLVIIGGAGWLLFHFLRWYGIIKAGATNK